MTEDYANNQAIKKQILQKTATWINEQIEQIWCALEGEKFFRKEYRELQIKQTGKQTFYRFLYNSSFCADAKSYFDQEEHQWKFELTQVAEEYYQSVHDYFTKKH